MTLKGNEGSMIPRNEARQMMENYRNSHAFPANNETNGILFGKDRIDEIFAQSGCTGVRIYYGKAGTANTDAAHLIIVGTNEDGNDMTELILDAGIPCPSLCSSVSTKL